MLLRLGLVQGITEDLPDGQLDLSKVNALLLIQGEAALLEEQMPK